MRSSFYTVLSLFIASSSCDCRDEDPTAFFDPEPFGEYELVPDIDGPSIVSFGTIPAFEQAEQFATLSNVGREPLVISSITATPPFFVQDGDYTLQFGERLPVMILAESSGVQAIGTLTVRSNDPDEDPFEVPLAMNLEESCVIQIRTQDALWEQFYADIVICWDTDFGRHGAVEAYDFASIPDPGSEGWRDAPDPGFGRRSILCGSGCQCRHGGDFTYFQTFLLVGEANAEYRVTMNDLDDGARVTVFNANFPNGVHAAYAFLGDSETTDIGEFLVPGSNRVVVTHIDDCCNESRLRDLRLRVDGEEIEVCR